MFFWSTSHRTPYQNKKYHHLIAEHFKHWFTLAAFFFATVDCYLDILL